MFAEAQSLLNLVRCVTVCVSGLGVMFNYASIGLNHCISVKASCNVTLFRLSGLRLCCSKGLCWKDTTSMYDAMVGGPLSCPLGGESNRRTGKSTKIQLLHSQNADRLLAPGIACSA